MTRSSSPWRRDHWYDRRQDCSDGSTRAERLHTVQQRDSDAKDLLHFLEPKPREHVPSLPTDNDNTRTNPHIKD